MQFPRSKETMTIPPSLSTILHRNNNWGSFFWRLQLTLSYGKTQNPGEIHVTRHCVHHSPSGSCILQPTALPWGSYCATGEIFDKHKNGLTCLYTQSKQVKLSIRWCVFVWEFAQGHSRNVLQYSEVMIWLHGNVFRMPYILDIKTTDIYCTFALWIILCKSVSSSDRNNTINVGHLWVNEIWIYSIPEWTNHTLYLFEDISVASDMVWTNKT